MFAIVEPNYRIREIHDSLWEASLRGGFTDALVELNRPHSVGDTVLYTTEGEWRAGGYVHSEAIADAPEYLTGVISRATSGQ